ncbi:MAG TPA: ATP-binding protein [Burkholderiales bacterium]|nr:ATP-binding protein [Burkholderiales bacterium]
MRLYYPRSFPALLGAGLTLIALPLLVALVTNAISIDRLANRSQNAVYQAAQATQSSRRLAELITALERTARQIVILADRSLFDAYQANRKRLEQTVGELALLPLDAEQKRALDEIVQEEKGIFAVLSDEASKEEQLAAAVTRFPGLADRAQVITAHSSELIDREVEAMRATADQAQRTTLWQLLALIPVVALLVVGFTILIARPIRQIDSAIRSLGGGKFNTPVVVNGPQDLEYLGERLEWLRQKLLDLEQQKNRFLRQMSHELKTPLTAVREGAELLSEEVVGKLTPQQREVAEILRHNSMELQKQIEDLLNYGASQFRRVTVALKPVSVQRVISRVAGDQRLALRSRNLKLDVSAQEVLITADFDMVRVALDNLVSNAIKFSPAGGTIRILAARNGSQVALDVVDEGPGIRPEERERVFEPFYQGSQAGAESGAVRGTGIGLSVVKEYMTAHGGSVEVLESTNGAYFRLKLPLASTTEVAT